MQFQLPGLPLFPAATDGLLLKPMLRWQIQSEKADRFNAELAYITGGLDWEATYNVVTPNSTDVTGEEEADGAGLGDHCNRPAFTMSSLMSSDEV